jgi:hypothetical protein
MGKIPYHYLCNTTGEKLMTFDEYLEECKARDPEFAAGYDSGYALYERLFKAKMAGQVTTLKVVLEPHQTKYVGFLAGSPPIRVHGATLAEARANLAQEVVWMLDPEYVQVEWYRHGGGESSAGNVCDSYVVSGRLG